MKHFLATPANLGMDMVLFFIGMTMEFQGQGSQKVLVCDTKGSAIITVGIQAAPSVTSSHVIDGLNLHLPHY